MESIEHDIFVDIDTMKRLLLLLLLLYGDGDGVLRTRIGEKI